MARKGNSDGFIHTVYAEGIWRQQQQLSMCVLPEGLFIPCLRLLIFEISIPIDTVPSPITHSTYIDPIFGAVYIVRRDLRNRNFPRGQAKSNGRLRASGNRRPWFGFKRRWRRMVNSACDRKKRERKRQAIKTRQQNEKRAPHSLVCHSPTSSNRRECSCVCVCPKVK